MKFKDMGLEARYSTQEVKINDTITLTVRNYLPIDEKTQFIQYVVDSALDSRTGCFSPMRVEVYFNLALCHWYAGIEFESLGDAGNTYDILETNGVIEAIRNAIDRVEMAYMEDLVTETTKDIARYNSSAAGIIQSMSSDSGTLSEEMNKLIHQVQDGEGLETLKEIQSLVETN